MGQDAGRTHEINPYIQGARGLFCMFVFFYHIHNSGLGTVEFLATGIPDFLLDTLEHGVELFFGISGIVIVGSLLRAGSAARFFENRVLRLLPVLWSTNIFVILVAIAFSIALPTWPAIIASFFAPPPIFGVHLVNPIAWTIGFEVTFYALCALWFVFRDNRLAIAVLVVLSAALLFVYPRTLMMLAGVCVALYGGRFALPRIVARNGLLVLLIYLVGLRTIIEVFGAGSVDGANPMVVAPGSIVPLELCLVAVTVVGGLLLLCIQRGEGGLGRFLGTSLMQHLGAISYSLYLWHIPIMAGVKRVIVAAGFGDAVYAQALLLVISLPITLVVATLSYRLVEKRLTSYLKGLLKRARSRPVSVGQS